MAETMCARRKFLSVDDIASSSSKKEAKVVVPTISAKSACVRAWWKLFKSFERLPAALVVESTLWSSPSEAAFLRPTMMRRRSDESGRRTVGSARQRANKRARGQRGDYSGHGARGAPERRASCWSDYSDHGANEEVLGRSWPALSRAVTWRSGRTRAVHGRAAWREYIATGRSRDTARGAVTERSWRPRAVGARSGRERSKRSVTARPASRASKVRSQMCAFPRASRAVRGG